MTLTPKEINKKIKEQKLSSPKFIRDPVHDIIKIEDRIILDLLDTEPMQRLRFIKQLPLASYVYPGSDHNRLLHSIGVYHLSIRMLDQLTIKNQYDRLVIKIAALLHDVGHGPFSHLFEDFLTEVKYTSKDFRNHEHITINIIKNNADIKNILDSFDPSLTDDVSSIISKTYKKNKQHLSHIVSSQFDADRLDYMLRDSYMSGTLYGKFDLNWLFRNLTIEKIRDVDEDGKPMRAKPQIAIDGKRGISALEEYFLGNLYLYKHLYFHHTIQSAEGLLVKILTRAVDCIKDQNINLKIDSRVLKKIANNESLELDDYISLNDCVILGWIHFWSKNNIDSILHRLSKDLINRNLYAAINLTDCKGENYHNIIVRVEEYLNNNGYNSKYDLIYRESRRITYKNLFFFRDKGDPAQEVYYRDTDKKIKPFTGIDKDKFKVSGAILGLRLNDQLIVVPKELEDDIKVIINEVNDE